MFDRRITVSASGLRHEAPGSQVPQYAGTGDQSGTNVAGSCAEGRAYGPSTLWRHCRDGCNVLLSSRTHEAKPRFGTVVMNDTTMTADPELEVIFTPEAIAGRLDELAREIAGEQAREPAGGCHPERQLRVRRRPHPRAARRRAGARGRFHDAVQLQEGAHLRRGRSRSCATWISTCAAATFSSSMMCSISGRTLAFAKDLIAGARRGVDPHLRAARQAVAARRQSRARLLRLPVSRTSSSSATVWMWRTAIASCRSSGASCAQ